ncbi:membrane-spanning 4-domains subfamily A member 14 [Echinops telfairi]|uniref:Membrane-spanning 4-domains subfamily A member 14 n=1 Tax=Echinops telfairi TaxID=9371 RepID=A0ABM0ZTD3_ECHTE|nr:membrane-spanning 4-domains subfamily A member 14 [Echinops telfairi]
MATSTQVERRSRAVTAQPEETVLTGFPYRPHRSLLDFLRGEPQVLGTVQILLGLIIAGLGSIILFNFITFSQRFPLVFLSGYPFWGALTFLLAGYFTGTKEKPQKCLRQCVTSMNVISSLVAIAGITLTMISYKDEHRFCQVPSLEGVCVVGRTLINGILSVILIASIAELSISITIITLRNKCWTKSRKIVFFLPSDTTEDNEKPAPGANAQIRFELQESSPNDRTTNTNAFSFGGYTFFRLRVSGRPQSQEISTDEQFLNVLYQDIRSEVMLQTHVWEVDLHAKKYSRRNSIVKQTKSYHSPRRESVDQESQGQKSPRRESVDQESQGQKSPRRKSIDQQIRDWIFAKRKSIDSYENRQPPRKQSSNLQDQQRAEGQQGQEEQFLKDQSHRGQGETQQPPKRQDKHQQTDKEEAPSLKPEAKAKKAQSKKDSMDQDWKLQIRESQDWISQGWRNKDWKAKEWTFEKQNTLNWQAQNLQEQEALRQRALYQDTHSKRTETRLNLDQELLEGQIQDIQGQNKLQQDLQAKATQTEDTQPGSMKTKVIKPGYMKPNDKKPKDSQPEVRANDPSSPCQDTEEDPYYAYLSSVSLEQYVERDTSVCSALYKEDMDLASTSCYQKDQPSEDSD